MNKYLSIYKTSVKQESKTLINSLTSLISLIVIVYVFKQLWEFIYATGTQTLIKGYTIEMMIWYLVVAEMVAYTLNAREVTQSFSYDIKSGKLAYKLNKPYNYFMYNIVTQCGIFSWKLCFTLPAGIIIGLVLLGPVKALNIIYFIPWLITLLAGLLLLCVAYGTIGLLSFWIEEATPFAWILNKMVLLLGVFFPPEFFPGLLQPLISYSPIYAMVSGPSKLFANFSWELFFNVFGVQMVYIVIFFVIGLALYKIGTRKVNMYGG